MSVRSMTDTDVSKLYDVLIELLSGIAFAKNLADVNCAAGAAMEDVKALTAA